MTKIGRAKLNVTTELQVFGLIVTAEPYFAVPKPSDLIILENEVRKGTKGRIFITDTKYELLQRGQYERLANPLALSLDLKKVPLDVYQARNALEIAKSLGAEQYASDVFLKAEASLEMADRILGDKYKRKEVIQQARQATQFAEDSRELAVKRQEEEALATERREGAEREAAANAKAAEEAQRRAEAEADRKEAQRNRLQAELAAARAAAEQARADAARAQAELQKEAARREAERARRAAQEAESLRQQAEREKAELRAKLLGAIQPRFGYARH